MRPGSQGSGSEDADREDLEVQSSAKTDAPVRLQGKIDGSDALLFRVRAALGQTESQRYLGYAYFEGNGVPKDSAEARRMAEEFEAKCRPS